MGNNTASGRNQTIVVEYIPMLYIISGASRSGKTLLAEKILAEQGINYLSLDWLIMGFTNGLPALGIHHMLFPDEIAERSWSFFKAMLESMLYIEENCVVEGEAILPELIVELKEQYPDQVRVCFVGYTDISIEEKVRNIKKYGGGKTDWLIDKSDEYIEDHVNNMIAHSKKIQQSCQENNIKYFDTSKSFLRIIEKTMQYMLG